MHVAMGICSDGAGENTGRGLQTQEGGWLGDLEKILVEPVKCVN